MLRQRQKEGQKILCTGPLGSHPVIEDIVIERAIGSSVNWLGVEIQINGFWSIKVGVAKIIWVTKKRNLEFIKMTLKKSS